jgi:predicted transcriptional regulator
MSEPTTPTRADGGRENASGAADADADVEFRDLMLAEEPGFADVMRCVFGVGEREIGTYRALLAAGETDAADLAVDLERDRSSVARALTALHEKELAMRRRELPEGGGQRYCYRASPPREVCERMHAELDAWTADVHDRIDAFAQRVQDG